KTLHMRLFVGGLAPNIKEQDLVSRFSRFGQVESVEFKRKLETFAFVNFEAQPEQIKKLISIYHHTKWNGHQMRIEEAQQDKMQRILK
ncbi:hypothetical protein EDD86DRAFT_177233, partial [Gorgonomyces haynaldii]